MKSSIKALKQAWHKTCVMYRLFYKNIKKDVNEKRIKHWFQQYFEDNNLPYGTWQLHHIGVVTRKSDIVVTITLGRPGLLIGKGGETIDEITKRLSDWLKKPVKIKINEYSVWS
jgi:ribosomal protein S3